MDLVAGFTEYAPIGLLDDLETVAAETGATVQGFDARFVVSEHHLERAVELADRAIERGEPIAEDRSVEILLYAAGRRQIERAFEMGLKEEAHPIVVVVDGGDETSAVHAVESLLDETTDPQAVLGDQELLCEYFDITAAERDTGAALEDLVLERVALLTIDK